MAAAKERKAITVGKEAQSEDHRTPWRCQKEPVWKQCEELGLHSALSDTTSTSC